MSEKTTEEVAAALAAYFDPAEVKWKAQTVREGRALAVAYVDARCVMDRLDEAVGTDGWQDEFVPLPDGTVMCRLSLRLGGAWLTRCDVGGPSEQPDDGDKVKAAFSDALKRAAVHWGIGRYLYRLPHQWVDYDPQRRQLKSKPRLPAWAVPAPAPAPPPDPRDGERVSADEARDVVERLEAAGKTWAAAARWLGLPEGTRVPDLNIGQYKRLIRTLSKPRKVG